MQESSTTQPAHLTGAFDAYGRPVNDQGFAPLDKDRVEAAVREFLLAIGEDPERAGLKETPERVARACEELFSGMREEPRAHLRKQFDEGEASGPVVVRDIPFESFCEHHILPFRGTAAIVYLPHEGRICGLSVQERLCAQIADALVEELSPEGVFVLLEAEHSCMTLRGIKSVGSTTVTCASRGRYAEDEGLRREALSLIGIPRG